MQHISLVQNTYKSSTALPRDALLARYAMALCSSVCLSVCPSVTSLGSTKTTKDVIT